MMHEPQLVSRLRITRSHARTLLCEPLEQRLLLSATSDQPTVDDMAPLAGALATVPTGGVSYPGGVTVTATQIITPNETIPRFVAQPSIVNVVSGAWNNPSIWSLGRVPTDGDRVQIAAGTSVSYTLASGARLNGLEVDGLLSFSTTANTRLVVGNLTVMPTGTLQVGTAPNPVAAGVSAQIVIADQALNQAQDPQQYGTGLIALGTVSIHGAPVASSWITLSAAAHAGNSTLQFSGNISFLRPGMTLTLADNRQLPTSDPTQTLVGQLESQGEQVTVDHVVGNNVFLTSPLRFDHLGVASGVGGVAQLPQVAVMDRNVIIRSENPSGTRGYMLFTGKASVDVENASLQNLGRTLSAKPVDNTTLDATGSVTHLGTNQDGRFAVYFDSLLASAAPPFTFAGNTVSKSLKWAVAVLKSSGGLIKNNIVYADQGSGLTTLPGRSANITYTNNTTIETATVASIRGGNWADASIWSNGRVPTDGDRVVLAAGTTVSYSTASDASLDSLEIDGSLVFSTNVDTRMVVGNVTVMPTGTLQVGTAASPVAAGVNAEIVIADQALTAGDAQQFGTGLIGLGTVSIHGAALNETWVTLAAEPHAGDTSLQVAGDISSWRPGQTVVLPDTRQVPTSQGDHFHAGDLASDYEDEEVTIDHIQGNQIFLSAPLQYDHLGAHNTSGALELLPQVALLDRNVEIRSENPSGTRGYTLFTGRANVDIEYASFENLGRTDAFVPTDDTTFDASGNVTHVGTNQSGRYAVYFDDLLGPTNATNTGYQFKFIGNTVDDARRWAVALDNSSFGLLQDNFVYDAQGAGFVTTTGSEIGNVFADNYTMSMQGTYADGTSTNSAGDIANGGSGFWFRRGGNTVTGNIAADSGYSGFVFDGYNAVADVLLPNFRGADPTVAGQATLTTLNPEAPFADNQAYGMSTYGLWAAFITGNDLAANQVPTLIENFQIWNAFSSAIVMYHTSNVTFDHLLILADQAAQDRNDTGSHGMDLENYENKNVVIENSRIEGVRLGIIAPTNGGSDPGVDRPMIIEDSTLIAYSNIIVTPGQDQRPSDGNSLEVRNVKFQMLTQLPPGPTPASAVAPPANITMTLAANNGSNLDLTQPSTVKVYDYNQVAGDDFQVFYHEQVASYVMPATNPNLLTGNPEAGLIGSPQAGLTNAQNWQKYGIALAGGIAPANATASRPEINGLIAPIQDISTLTPRVVLVTPWDGATFVDVPYVRVRFEMDGVMPAGDNIFFSLDGSGPIAEINDPIFWHVAPGPHVLKAYIGDSQGRPLFLGTIPSVVHFTTLPRPASPAISPAVMLSEVVSDGGTLATDVASTDAGEIVPALIASAPIPNAAPHPITPFVLPTVTAANSNPPPDFSTAAVSSSTARFIGSTAQESLAPISPLFGAVAVALQQELTAAESASDERGLQGPLLDDEWLAQLATDLASVDSPNRRR